MKLSLDTKNDGLRLHLPPDDLKKLIWKLIVLISIGLGAFGAGLGTGQVYSIWHGSPPSVHEQPEAIDQGPRSSR